jgi:1-deoxy-D-xylulose-5-phosphate reductoisomerase
VAVAAFLDRRLGFLQIAEIVETVLAGLAPRTVEPSGLDDIYEIDRLARIRAEEVVHLVRR